jgi:hypothetical protein
VVPVKSTDACDLLSKSASLLELLMLRASADVKVPTGLLLGLETAGCLPFRRELPHREAVSESLSIEDVFEVVERRFEESCALEVGAELADNREMRDGAGRWTLKVALDEEAAVGVEVVREDSVRERDGAASTLVLDPELSPRPASACALPSRSEPDFGALAPSEVLASLSAISDRFPFGRSGRRATRLRSAIGKDCYWRCSNRLAHGGEHVFENANAATRDVTSFTF